MSNRYIIKTGKFESHFHDDELGIDLDLDDVLQIMNYEGHKPKQPTLKPCPFCDNKPVGIFKDKSRPGRPTYHIRCTNCGLDMFDVTEAGVIASWQIRAAVYINKKLNKKLNKRIMELLNIIEASEFPCCETCKDYMIESKNCKHNTEFGCSNWRKR